MSAKTPDGTLLEDAERIENWAVVVVIGAITIEGFLLFASNETWFFKIGDFIASVAVAVAILIELKFGGVVSGILKSRLADADERLTRATEESSLALHLVAQAELRAAEMEKEAAETRERAAKLELRAAPRIIDTDKFQALLGDVRPCAVEIWFDQDVPDARDLAVQLQAYLLALKWPATLSRIPPMNPAIMGEPESVLPKNWSLGAPSHGISVFTGSAASEAVIDARLALGHALELSVVPEQPIWPGALGDGLGGVPADKLRVIIGPKSL
jgi:hypothetical protein